MGKFHENNFAVMKYLSYIYLGYFVCVCVCVCVSQLRNAQLFFCFSNQTDQGDETKGLEIEGLMMER
jgi:hypothetical protein